jgi:biotin carboxyl carrier protein
MTDIAVIDETALLDGCDRLVVSPAYGKLKIPRPASYTSEGEFVRAGDVLATMLADGSHLDVTAPCDAWVMGYIAHDGERVEPGTAIVHLRAL